MSEVDTAEVDAAVVRLAREDAPRVLALLAGRLDDVDLADDAVQDALLRAVETWPVQGIPANPPGWLSTVAHNRAVDRLQLQALITSIHTAAPTFAATDWALIAVLYATLEDLDPNPVVRLNRAVAVAYAQGVPEALDLLDAIHGLDGYHLLHATRGELLLRIGAPGAREAFERALALAPSEPERRHLRARIAAAGS